MNANRAIVFGVLLAWIASGCNLQRHQAGPVATPSWAVYGSPFPSPTTDDQPEVLASASQEEISTLATLNDLDAVGEAARALLQEGAFTQIVVEIDAVRGLGPSPEAKEVLRQRIATVTGKPVTFQGSSYIDSNKNSYTINDLTALSEKRQFKSVEPAISIWIAYLDGFVQENPYGLGVSMSSTSIAVFPRRIKTTANNATPPIEPDLLETATLVHELGHLLGLVNLIYESPRDHADPHYPGHSKNPRSVMYKGIEQAFGATIFGAGPPSTEFDSDDLADLRDIAEGRL